MISSINTNQANGLQNLTNIKTSKYTQGKESEGNKGEQNIGINTRSGKNLLEKVDLVELRKYAEYAGESNITDDDIRYGLIYGRSVIADYLA